MRVGRDGEKGDKGGVTHLGGGQKGVPWHERPERGTEGVGAGKRGRAPPVRAASQRGAGFREHKVEHAAGGEEVHTAAERAQCDSGAH